MLRHYKGLLGEFNYHDDVFRVETKYCKDALCYIGNDKAVSLPKGCINTRYMFCGCKLPEGFTLHESFDTGNVVDMTGMFYNSNLPEGFSFGPNFNTGNVVDMTGMFEGCHAHTALNLGPNFNTVNVVNMERMFSSAIFDNGIELGDGFDTSHVKKMDEMFIHCNVGNSLSLGDKFNTSNVEDFGAMFYCFRFPSNFKFPSCFTITDNVNLTNMFYCAKFPKNFCLDIECNITNGQFDIFQGCNFPEGFSFGSRFSVAGDVQSKAIFDDCYVNDKMLCSVLPCNYAIDVVRYVNDTLGRRYCMTINNHYVCRDDLAKHLSQTLNVSKDSVCDAINLFAQKYSDEDSNTESEGMNLF